jgi:hypothetical protein
VDWNSSTRSSGLRVAPVAIPMELWSLPLLCFIESHHSLSRHYLCNNYTLFVTFGYLWTLLGRMCGTIDPGSCIRCVLGFSIKTGYDIHRGGGLGPCGWLTGSVNPNRPRQDLHSRLYRWWGIQSFNPIRSSWNRWLGITDAGEMGEPGNVSKPPDRESSISRHCYHACQLPSIGSCRG